MTKLEHKKGAGDVINVDSFFMPKISYLFNQW
jgi:hypothetical protein